MRKIEYIPWGIIALTVSICAIYFIWTPVEYPAMAVEIEGTLIGFLLALSFAELIKIYDRSRQFKEVVRGLVNEMRYILSVLSDDLFWFDIDMWKMAISSGNLGLLDEDLLGYFRTFYSHAHVILDMGNMLKMALANGNEELANEMIKAMKPFKAKMREVGKLVLE
ncbi:MAG: hypothetical protein ACFFER_12085 [Candidatus Thorarchaeota archaeon]